MKKYLLLLVILIFSSLIFASNPASFEISCTPIVTYSVTISTPPGGLTFNVEPGNSYVNISTVTIKNTGNVSADWTIRGIPLDTWQLGTTPGDNTIRLLGVLKSSLATFEEFEIDKDTITENERNMKSPNYSVDQDGDNVPVNGERLLSIRVDAPTDTSVDTQQRFRIEIRVYPRSKF